MALYCGIDLHANNHLVVVIDDKDRRLVEKRVPNALERTLALLAPYRQALAGIAVESTFNWYWLVDGLMEQGYRLHLVNTAAVKQYEGLKHTDDRHDAFHLAHLLRLGILPTGYICPKAHRAVRDLMRRRAGLVRMAARALLSVQSQIWRDSGERVSANRLKRADFMPPPADPLVQLPAEAALRVHRALQIEIDALEAAAREAVTLDPRFAVLTTIKGVGPILALTIMLETGAIERFPSAGDYASYCRLVRSAKHSNGKRKGEGNRKCGNKYLSWAFSEAAHFALRYEPAAKRFYERKRARTNDLIAIRALAHKLARAAYYMLRDQAPFEASRLFAP